MFLIKLCFNVFNKFRKKTSNLLKHIESVCTLTGSEFLLISYIKVNKFGPYKGEQDQETKFLLKRQRKPFHCHLFFCLSYACDLNGNKFEKFPL